MREAVRVLVGKTFGIGNLLMSVPMIKAIGSLPDVEQIDMLVGTHHDDVGATEIAQMMRESGIVADVYHDRAPHYDVAVMSIPFDGRWKNHEHFVATRVVDGRPRPNFDTVVGLDSWKKHEVEYQMENARELGYSGPTPSMQIAPHKHKADGPPRVYLGVGFKRDRDSFWSVKHWGNDKFVELIERVLAVRDDVEFCTSEDDVGFATVVGPMMRKLNGRLGNARSRSLRTAFELVSMCDLYVGNDTGMMHVAASMGIPCVVSFALPGSERKNYPWDTAYYANTPERPGDHATVEQMELWTLQMLESVR